MLRAVDRPDFEVLAETFATNMAASLAALNRSTWAMTDSFDAHGRPIAEGLRARIDGYWSAFRNGVFGLCVADPGSEETIARKEVLQEKLAALTGNGSRIDSAAVGRADLTTLIDAYDRAAMPFAPREYPNSSRKRLVDDLREKLANLLP